MMVSRSLLRVEEQARRAFAPGDPEGAAARAFDRLRDSPAGGYVWRERADWAARLYRGDGDERGRRLFSDARRMDARYVARVSRRAMHGQLPESKVEWGHLRESMRRILTELRGAA